MFELLFDVMGPFPKHLDFFSPYSRNVVTPILRYFNHRIEVRTPARIRPYPYGTAPWGVAMSQAFRARLRSHCPSGDKEFARRGLALSWRFWGSPRFRKQAGMAGLLSLSV